MQLFSAMFLGTVFSTSLVSLDLEVNAAYRHAFWTISALQLLFCALPPLTAAPPRKPSYAKLALAEEEQAGVGDAHVVLASIEDAEAAAAGGAGARRERARACMIILHAGLIIFFYCAAEGIVGAQARSEAGVETMICLLEGATLLRRSRGDGVL